MDTKIESQTKVITDLDESVIENHSFTYSDVFRYHYPFKRYFKDGNRMTEIESVSHNYAQVILLIKIWGGFNLEEVKLIKLRVDKS